MRPLADHVARAGLAASMPVAAARLTEAGIDALAVGNWPDGTPVTLDDRFYGASLSKQVAGAAAALLVRAGRLDPDEPIGLWLGDLPDWVGATTVRQLAHHIAGLPAAGELEARVVGDWTEASALAALRETGPSATPGSRYSYSNIGYVLLAQVVAAASGAPFATFVEERLFAPPALTGMGFAADITAFQQVAPMGPSLPLTHGDGGLWTTALAFAHWLQVMNTDAFGIADIVEANATPLDGNSGNYGWGIGLRQHRGHPLFIHGGEWPGAAAKAVRCPALGISIVALAAGAPFAMVDRLVASLLDES